VSIFFILGINPVRPCPSYSVTESQSLQFSVKIFSWSTLPGRGGGLKKIFHWTQTHSQQYWNQGAQTDRDILANKPGIVINNKKSEPAYHWIPSDRNVIKRRLKIY